MQWYTSVSRGGLNNGVPGFEEPGSLSILHHPETDPVLHTAAGIEVFTLGHYKHIKETCFITGRTDRSLSNLNKHTTLQRYHVVSESFVNTPSTRELRDLHISHFSPYTLGILLMRTKGVSPIRCRMFGRMAGAVALGGGKKVRRECNNEETNCRQLPGTTCAANLCFLSDTSLNKCARKSSTP